MDMALAAGVRVKIPEVDVEDGAERRPDLAHRNALLRRRGAVGYFTAFFLALGAASNLGLFAPFGKTRTLVKVVQMRPA